MYLPTAAKVVLASLPTVGLAVTGYISGRKYGNSIFTETEYVAKLTNSPEINPKQVCLKIVETNNHERSEEVLKEENCKKILESIESSNESKPDVLLRTNKDNLRRELIKNSLLLEDEKGTTKVESGSTWTLLEILKCTSRDDSKNSSKVIVSCNYLTEH